jgi:hypothetical protein
MAAPVCMFTRQAPRHSGRVVLSRLTTHALGDCFLDDRIISQLWPQTLSSDRLP